jgi:magnesium chelatase accessory protein
MTASPPFPRNKTPDFSTKKSKLPMEQRKLLNWDDDGFNWPNCDASRFVIAGGIRWHVQIMGQGPELLLLHGTGAASHSWRDLAPLLAQHYKVLTVDLPGHGFTQAPAAHRLSLPGMATLLASLMDCLKFKPELVVGHSAGAAIAAQMCLDGSVSPRWLVSLNGAWMPFAGLPGQLFSPLAKFLAHKRFWAKLFAHRAANRQFVEQLIAKTGSVIDSYGIDLYAKLARDTDHIAAALGMMANWDLRPMLGNLQNLETNLLLVVGDNDRMVPPAQADWLKSKLPKAQIRHLPECGHLFHEEKPEQTASLIDSLKQDTVGSQTT